MNNEKKIKILRIAGSAAVALTYIILWIVPSNVARLVARDKDILLGRFSLERMTLLLIYPLLAAPVLYLLFARNKRNFKIRVFQVVAILITVIPGLFIVDGVLRLKNKSHYVRTTTFHRPPNQKYELTIQDKPEKSGRFQTARPGFPDIKCTLTVDSLGFRNIRDYDTCDIIAIGDSFVEGSHVSDESTWPALLSGITGKSVCNLGISGTDPLEYLNRFKKVGVEKKPSVCVLMIYEGNDFLSDDPLDARLKALEQGHAAPQTFSRRLRYYKKTSPVIQTLRGAIISMFSLEHEAPPAETGEGKGTGKAAASSGISPELIKGIAWLPVKEPDNSLGKYYSFPPKRMLRLYNDDKVFRSSNGWKCAEYAILKMKKESEEKGIRLIVVFAPSKPHVLLPLVKGRISPEVLHAFAALKDSSIPPPVEFAETLYKRLDVINTAIKNVCDKNGIEFVDTTVPLREKMKKGVQVYFTYDQHWTPDGQETVAETIAGQLEKRGPAGK